MPSLVQIGWVVWEPITAKQTDRIGLQACRPIFGCEMCNLRDVPQVTICAVFLVSQKYKNNETLLMVAFYIIPYPPQMKSNSVFQVLIVVMEASVPQVTICGDKKQCLSTKGSLANSVKIISIKWRLVIDQFPATVMLWKHQTDTSSHFVPT